MLLDLVGQTEQPQDLGDVGPGEALPAGDLGLVANLSGVERAALLDGLVQELGHLERPGFPGRLGVTVVSRKLRYRWEWGFDQSSLPNPRDHQGEQRAVEVTPFRRSREKGIDLALGLDVVDLALRGLMDVAVIVSTDTDLTEVARAVCEMTRSRGRRVSVEAAVFNERRKPVLLADYDYTHQLGRNDFEEARDSFNYRGSLDPTMQQAFLASCEQYRVTPG